MQRILSRAGWISVACVALLHWTSVAAHPDTTFIPLPEVIVDPNEGTTVGVLPVLIFASESKSIRSMLAPDVRFNDITGIYPTLRFFDYPTPKQKYFLMAGKATKRGEYAEANYTGQDLFDGWFDLRGSAVREEDPFERFFGLGNDSPGAAETNFTSATNAVTAFAGLNLPASFQTSLQARLRHVRIGRGGVTSLPQLRDASSGFSTVKGADGATIVGLRSAVTYDTRDSADIPTEGVFVDAGAEVVDRAFGSSASFIKYGLEGQAYVPLWRGKQVVAALHGMLDYIENGRHAPFFERSRVGGIHSLRGFGSGRFTDDHRVVLQGELRTNVYEREIFGVRAHLEVAPFVDLAKVFHNPGEFPIENLHAVGGVGLRAVVAPQVVAYIDAGTSGGTPAVFTGIDYPF